MAATRFMWNNLVDTATITASSEDAALPGSNIANALRAKVWRTATASVSPDVATAENIVIDLGSAKAVTSVILLDHDLTASDTGIVLEGNDSDSWGAPSFSQPLTRVSGVIAAYFSSQSYRYWRVAFTKSAASETREIGRVFLGAYDTLPIASMNISPVDTSKTTKTIGGQTYNDIRPIYDDVMIQTPPILKATSDIFKAIFDSVGMHKPYFISIDHDIEPVDWIYYVKAKSIPSFLPAITTTYWKLSINMSEQL